MGGANAHSTLRGDYETHEIEMLDGRELGETFDLDTHGFELRAVPQVGDLYDPAVVEGHHDPQCCELVRSATGAVRAHVFDHTWRSDDAGKRGRYGSREPSAFVHNDYTPRSAIWRIEAVMGEDARSLERGDFAIVNVWRPIRSVLTSPLAVCDARSLSQGSLVPAERRSEDRVGEIYLVRFDARQRWIYFPQMSTAEVLLVKTFDSRADGRARWCAHTSFEQPDVAPGTPPRESMETRLFAFFA